MWMTLLLVLHVVIAIAIIVLVLLQHGKGADAGAAFGSGAGASATVFGAQGAGNFLTRLTAGLATLFFVSSLALAYFSGTQLEGQGASVVDRVDTSTVPIPEENGATGGVGIPQPD